MAKPITVTIGPLAIADADGVSVSQTAAAAQYLVINGALCGTTFDADSICASQSPAGSGALTLNGANVAGGVAYFNPTPVRVYITSAGNDSGRTFTIAGTIFSVTGPPIYVTETVTGANTNTVATTKTFNTVTSVTISGASAAAVTVGHSGTATMDMARRVIITSAGNDTGITFTLSGTDWAGNTISETVTGASGAAASSVLDYLTVTSVLTSGATAGGVQVGTNGVAASPWVHFDPLGGSSEVSIQATVSGTVNFTVQQTLDSPVRVTNAVHPNTGLARSAVTWVSHPDTALASATATAQGNYAYAPVFARVLLNSGTGTVTTTFRHTTGG